MNINMNKGVISRGISAPMIKEGDDLVRIVVDSVINEVKNTTVTHIPYYIEGVRAFRTEEHMSYDINDKDIIGITESVIARAAGQYISVDDIAADIEKKFGKDAFIRLINPIYSRNRFSMILKGIARAAKKLYIIMPSIDEVGNPSGVNPFTGVNIQEYYKEICESENCEVFFWDGVSPNNCRQEIPELKDISDVNTIYCGLHDYTWWKEHLGSSNHFTLADICDEFSPDWGLLGTNKSTEERLKLFPSKEVAQKVCDEVKAQIKDITGKDVIVMGYGDGCFHSPSINGVSGTSIWEFADPVSFLPSSLDEELLNSCPNEIKVKYLVDNKYSNLSGDELNEAIQADILSVKENLKGKMVQEGCTPRRYGDLLASLMDLTSGSGSRCTPIVLVQHYFE